MSKDIPIIFSGPMVRALQEGRKTQTRRIIKLPTKGEYVRPDMGGWAAANIGGGGAFKVRKDGTREPVPELVAIWNQTTGTCIAANYQPGDRLWVREAVARIDNSEFGQVNYWQYRADTDGACFPGDWPAEEKDNPDRPHWRPSIHMPREASRLTLLVVGVKVERLQDISHDDAVCEGTSSDGGPGTMLGFINIWKALHGAESWAANPFVVAITFRVIKANIDAPEARAAA